MERLVLLVDVQLLFTLLLVALLWSFQARLRKQRFFRWWAWAWTLFALHLMFGALSLRLGPAWTLLKISLVSGSVLFGLLEAPLLIFGAWSLQAPRALPGTWVKAGISLTLGAGLLTLWLALSWQRDPATSFLLRAAPRMFVLAAAFGYCAAAFLRRWHAERSWAAMITGGFCLLYGVDQGFYGLLLINRLVANLLPPLRQALDVTLRTRTEVLSFDLICSSGICLGMVLLLLEEHQRTELALTQCHSRGREMAAENTALQAEISERIRLQEALRESEAKFRSLAETVACGIWIHDGEHFLYFNPHLVEVTGYSRQELFAMSVWDVVHPDYRQIIQARSQARKRGETVPSHSEFKILTRSGEERWLDFTARLTRFEGKQAILGTAFDITERKRMERALQDSEETFSKIFRASPNILILTRAGDFCYLQVNEAFERVTGYASAEVVGRNFLEVRLSDEGDELLQRITTQGTIRNAVWHFRDRAGQGHVGLLSCDIITISGRECFLTAVADVTDLKLAEEKAAAASQLYREIFNSSEDGIIISTPEGKVLDANPAASRILGYSREEILVLGRKGLLDKSDPLRSRRFLQQRAQAGAAKGELTVVRKDGKKILTEGFSHLFHDQQGRSRATVVFRDITARKQTEEALAGVSRRLIAAQEKERSWVARELHDDINQRIALLAIELARLRQQARSQDGIHAQLEALCKLTSEIGTDIQRISHHLHSPKLEYLGLEVASRSLCREMAEQHRITVDFRHSTIPDSIPAEIALCLFRVLQEALSNAIKYSGTDNLEVELGGSGDGLHLTVRDSGCGFDPAAGANHQGIGLTSMRERISLVGGKISIKSTPGVGTVITAHVPLAAQSDEVDGGRVSA